MTLPTGECLAQSALMDQPERVQLGGDALLSLHHLSLQNLIKLLGAQNTGIDQKFPNLEVHVRIFASPGAAREILTVF